MSRTPVIVISSIYTEEPVFRVSPEAGWLPIHTKIPEQPTLTVAVLSALNITEDLFKERERSKSASSLVEEEVRKLSNYLDNCLREV